MGQQAHRVQIVELAVLALLVPEFLRDRALQNLLHLIRDTQSRRVDQIVLPNRDRLGRIVFDCGDVRDIPAKVPPLLVILRARLRPSPVHLFRKHQDQGADDPQHTEEKGVDPQKERDFHRLKWNQDTGRQDHKQQGERLRIGRPLKFEDIFLSCRFIH